MTVHLVTGNAGFIGYHVARRLLEAGRPVVGYDVVNDYYEVELKQARLRELERVADETGTSYAFVRADLADAAALDRCFADHAPRRVVHLAAQAGVRYSLENPRAYVDSNVTGFTNILEACRAGGVEHLVYASTSSVYGANRLMPFSEHHRADHPLQFYAATKRANELMAHAYSHLYRLPTTGLRFFTVYGPWGRPDMAPFLFTRCILEGRPIKLFNNGDHSRDFTFVDDIVEGILRTSDRPAAPDPRWNALDPDPATSDAPFRLFNIGNRTPIRLLDFVEALEEAFGRKAKRELVPLQPGDVPDTLADTGELERAVGYRPSTSLKDGVEAFATWYKRFYGV